MEGDDSELLAAEDKTVPAVDLRSIIIDLRRMVYRCELLQVADFSDSDRQTLWESVVVSYYRSFLAGRLADHVEVLEPIHLETHERLECERTRHSFGETVIPDGLCPLDLEAGALATPYVDPAAARALAEALIKQLGG